MYFPNVDVTMSGNSQNANTACTEVIANSLNFGGGTSLSQHAKLRYRHRSYHPSCRFGAMMRKLDQRGVAALEFCLVAVPLFILMFAIFDLGRYAITMQSLRMLANAGARAMDDLLPQTT